MTIIKQLHWLELETVQAGKLVKKMRRLPRNTAVGYPSMPRFSLRERGMSSSRYTDVTLSGCSGASLAPHAAAIIEVAVHHFTIEGDNRVYCEAMSALAQLVDEDLAPHMDSLLGLISHALLLLELPDLPYWLWLYRMPSIFRKLKPSTLQLHARNIARTLLESADADPASLLRPFVHFPGLKLEEEWVAGDPELELLVRIRNCRSYPQALQMIRDSVPPPLSAAQERELQDTARYVLRADTRSGERRI